MFDLHILILAPLIVVIAYTIFGLSGFGSTLIAVPLLALLHPDLKFVMPVVIVMDCITAMSMGMRLRADVNRYDLLPLLPFLVIGLAFGVFLLVNLPATVLLSCWAFSRCSMARPTCAGDRRVSGSPAGRPHRSDCSRARRPRPSASVDRST